MSARFCKVCEGWHSLEEPWPIECWRPKRVARSDLPFPMIISDEMPPAEHVDGNTYTSKSSFRKVTRREGFIEIGDQKLPPPVKKRPDRRAIKDSVAKAHARYERGERVNTA